LPDGARLVGAILLALLAFVLSQMVKPLMPEDTNFGWFDYVNVVLGLAVGWRWVGARAGRGWTAAINIGLTGAFVLIFWALFVQAANEMVRLAMKNRYDGAFEALIAIFEIGTEWFLVIATVPVLAVAAAGGILTGMLAEVGWRIWR